MNVRDLITLLEEHDDSTEVRFMSQPQWPFEYSICGMTSSTELAHCDQEEYEDREEYLEEVEEILYLVEGTQLGYGNKNAWSLV